jgi:hypothetical protein
MFGVLRCLNKYLQVWHPTSLFANRLHSTCSPFSCHPSVHLFGQARLSSLTTSALMWRTLYKSWSSYFLGSRSLSLRSIISSLLNSSLGVCLVAGGCGALGLLLTISKMGRLTSGWAIILSRRMSAMSVSLLELNSLQPNFSLLV